MSEREAKEEVLRAIMEGREPTDGNNNGSGPSDPPDWLGGSPMDPAAVSPEPVATLPGFPFLTPGTGALIVGPSGGGRSSLMEACQYDAAMAGLRCAYLGHEVDEDEFNARAAYLAELRGDTIDDALRERLARVRYFDLMDTIAQAWEQPQAWVDGVCASFEVVVIDPLSAVESALGLNFQNDNNEYTRFYDRLIRPVTTRGPSCVLIENIGHAVEAKGRAKGVSAKQDRTDFAFSCAPASSPPGLVMRMTKRRSIRTSFRVGDEWLFVRDTQLIERRDVAVREAADDEDNDFRPTVLMQLASKFLEGDLGPGVTLNAIKEGVSGKDKYVAVAVKKLVAEGYVGRRQGPRNSQLHHSVRPYREADDPVFLTEAPIPGLGGDAGPQSNGSATT